MSCDPATGAVETVSERPAPAFAVDLRGGSQGVPLGDGGFLFVVHEAGDSGRQRAHRHRFVKLEPDFRLSAWSQPFDFVSDGIEFCAGLAPWGSRLILTFGVEDAEAALAIADLDEVLALLEPLPSW